MKKALSVTATIVFMFALAGCNGSGQGISLLVDKDIHGTYLNQDDPSEYLELEEDGTFFLKEEGVGWSGEWEIEDDTMTLDVDEIGMAARATMEDGRIVDEGGKVWVKGERRSEPASLNDLSEAACEDMSLVPGSDDWRTYNRAEKRASEAGFTTSEFDDAIRDLCPAIFSEYVNNQ